MARSLDLSDRPYPADTSFSSNPPKKQWAEFSDLPGCNIEMTVSDHNPAVINNPAVTGLVRNVAQDVVGAEGVLAMPPVSPSDDVSEFLNRIPGSYFFVGAGKADHSSGMHHNPQFSIEEVCMPIAATILATAAVNAAQPN